MSERERINAVSMEFRDLSSRAARAHFEHFGASLRHLLDFVAETPITNDAVTQATRPDIDISGLLEHCLKRRERIAPAPTRATELGYLHDILASLANDDELLQRIVYSYAGKSKFQESVGALIEDALIPYVTHLRRFITAELARHTPDSQGSKFEMTAAGGLSQIVVHQGVGDIQSSQVATQEVGQVIAAARELEAYLQGEESRNIPASTRAELLDVAKEARREVAKAEPSRWGLKAMKERLEVIAAGAQAAGAVGEVMQPLLVALQAYLQA